MPTLFHYLIAAMAVVTGAVQVGGHTAQYARVAAIASAMGEAAPAGRLVEVRRSHGCYVGSCF